MNRRKFTVGLGSLATAGAAAIGTGAFTSVEANRSIEVDVANDANAFFSLEGDGEYVSESGDTIVIALGGPTTSGGGEGFNDNAKTEVEEVVTIRNQGTQPAEVGFGNPEQEEVLDFPAQGDFNPARVTLTIADNNESDAELGPGDETSIDATVNTRDDLSIDPSGGQQKSVTLTADAGEADDDGDSEDGVGAT
jgi:hypothetical protein